MCNMYSLLITVPLQVKGVMVSNIEKVTQRGDKLDDLGERAGLYDECYLFLPSCVCTCVHILYSQKS